MAEKAKRQVDENINQLMTLMTLTNAFAEISARRMRRTREGVVTTRDFLTALDDIFKDVRVSYAREVAQLAKKRSAKGGERITFLAHNGKTVSVFISANTGLYGDIVNRTFERFKKDVTTGASEMTIIGRLGRALFLESFGERPYTYFDFPDVGVAKEDLAKIISHLVPYERINLYFGKFKSVVYQQPEVFEISAETPISLVEEGEGKVTKYLFEPSLEEILIFFESEMFASLLEQTIKESQLAKFAARMLAMDKAYGNIKDRLSGMRLERLKLTHDEANQKQQMLFSSFKLWRK
jgi:ATP synthase F1 gamma subunit